MPWVDNYPKRGTKQSEKVCSKFSDSLHSLCWLLSAISFSQHGISRLRTISVSSYVSNLGPRRDYRISKDPEWKLHLFKKFSLNFFIAYSITFKSRRCSGVFQEYNYCINLCQMSIVNTLALYSMVQLKPFLSCKNERIQFFTSLLFYIKNEW